MQKPSSRCTTRINRAPRPSFLAPARHARLFSRFSALCLRHMQDENTRETPKAVARTSIRTKYESCWSRMSQGLPFLMHLWHHTIKNVSPTSSNIPPFILSRNVQSLFNSFELGTTNATLIGIPNQLDSRSDPGRGKYSSFSLHNEDRSPLHVTALQ